MSNLDKAILIAGSGHIGQKDKSGDSYILHPLRVMLQMQTEEEMIVAVLHDVVEDCNVALNDIRQIFQDEVAEAVDALTRRHGESYMEYVRRAIKNPLAKKVKLADLKDNMDPRRCKNLNDDEFSSRMERYAKALKEINKEQ